MKRKWNWPIWIGFIIAVGAALLLVGLFRAFGRPQVYRGKVFGSIFAVLSILLFAFFSYEIFYVLRQVPFSAQAPRVGEKAPEFTLPRIEIQWTERELESLAELAAASKPRRPTEALIRAMRD